MSAPTDAPQFCNCRDDERVTCQEPFAKFKNKSYCLFHLPSEEKDRNGAFKTAVDKRVKTGNYNFRGVWFPIDYSCNHTFGKDADFSNAVFNAKANFSDATFNGKVHFSGAEFRSDTAFLKTPFTDADFSSAKFDARANFYGASFLRASFKNTIFGKDGSTNFDSAKFQTSVTFQDATFRVGVTFTETTIEGKAIFAGTSFHDYVRFQGTKENQVFGNKSELIFRPFKTDTPEQVSFRFLMLKPHWFVFVDPRKFDFTRVKWHTKITKELEAVKALEFDEAWTGVKRKFDFPHDRLATVCQRLAANYEENNVFEQASKFRYMAMAVEQRKTANGWAFWKLSWWYGLASGYGERTWQAAVVLIAIWAVFAVIFFFGQGNNWWKNSQTPGEGTSITTETGDRSQPLGPETRTLTVAITSGVKTSPLLSFRDALIYGAGVMTLQKPEPQPANKLAKSFVLLETILGPVQAALLALAIRRKFMH
ncbi:MAG TPA: pentapeptide repeat-containing protein [Pyrinomonadaceae bacterium]|nr:pentapeptide repeat-containing protein [Pyrinomonadaceae bacterium]